MAAVGNSTDNTTTSTNATDTGTDTESDGAPQMVMVPSPDYMTLEMPPYGQVKAFFVNVYLLFNRRTNGLGGDQSVGIVSSTSTRTLAPTISLN